MSFPTLTSARDDRDVDDMSERRETPFHKVYALPDAVVLSGREFHRPAIKSSTTARSMLSNQYVMKVADHERRSRSDFYISTLAPVNDRRRIPFSAADAAVLIVLFLEIGILVRLFLAN